MDLIFLSDIAVEQIVFSNKKEQTTGMYNNMDESQKHVEWNNPYAKGYTDLFTCSSGIGETKLWWKKPHQYLPGGRLERGLTGKRHERTFYHDSKCVISWQGLCVHLSEFIKWYLRFVHFIICIFYIKEKKTKLILNSSKWYTCSSS